MTQATPTLPCADWWPGGLPRDRRDVYERLAATGMVRMERIIRTPEGDMVEYLSSAPHDWTLDCLRRIREENQ